MVGLQVEGHVWTPVLARVGGRVSLHRLPFAPAVAVVMVVVGVRAALQCSGVAGWLCYAAGVMAEHWPAPSHRPVHSARPAALRGLQLQLRVWRRAALHQHCRTHLSPSPAVSHRAFPHHPHRPLCQCLHCLHTLGQQL